MVRPVEAPDATPENRNAAVLDSDLCQPVSKKPELTAESYSFVCDMMSEEHQKLRVALREALKPERDAACTEQKPRREECVEVEMHCAKARSR